MEVADPETTTNEEIKVYSKRWLVLIIFCTYSMGSLAQITEYAVIADIIVKFYRVDYIDVYWTGMIFMFMYIPFIFPCCYIIDKLGLRKSMLLGLVGTCVGLWIKVASIERNKYWALLIGQGVCAVFQVFVLPVPPKLAAVWFGANEVSLACSIGLFSISMGAAFGFLLSPFFVSHGDQTTIGNGLFLMSISYAVFTTMIIPVMYFYFDNAPASPPSTTQTKINKLNSNNFTKSFKSIMTNRSFLMLVLSYGITIGIFYSTCSGLNQMILNFYPNAATHVGIIGLLLNLVGGFGLLACGVFLDQFRLFKETTLGINSLCLASLVAFFFSVEQGLIIVYIGALLYGFFLNAIFCISYEMTVELTYPASESTSGGILTAVAQLFGIIFIHLSTYLDENVGELYKRAIICICQIIAVLLVFLIKYDLKRQLMLRGNKTTIEIKNNT